MKFPAKVLVCKICGRREKASRYYGVDTWVALDCATCGKLTLHCVKVAKDAAKPESPFTPVHHAD